MPALALAEETAFVEDATNSIWKATMDGSNISGGIDVRDALLVSAKISLDFPGGEIADPSNELEATYATV